jgi:predicted aldo/keto reductase-like oxidoreductase
MRYRKMPKIDIALSTLGFGCMRLPTTEDGNLDKKRSIEQIRYSIDNGVNYFDTAWPYHGGQSESVLGEALENGYRDKAYVATKLPSWLVQSRQAMDEYLDAQLARLNK